MVGSADAPYPSGTVNSGSVYAGAAPDDEKQRQEEASREANRIADENAGVKSDATSSPSTINVLDDPVRRASNSSQQSCLTPREKGRL